MDRWLWQKNSFDKQFDKMISTIYVINRKKKIVIGSLNYLKLFYYGD